MRQCIKKLIYVSAHNAMVVTAQRAISDGYWVMCVTVRMSSSPYRYTEAMALIGYIEIGMIEKEYSNGIVIYSLGNPSTGNWCAAWLFLFFLPPPPLS